MADELIGFDLLRVADDDAAEHWYAADQANMVALPAAPVIAPPLPAVSMVLFASSCRVLCYIATLCLKTEDS